MFTSLKLRGIEFWEKQNMLAEVIFANLLLWENVYSLNLILRLLNCIII